MGTLEENGFRKVKITAKAIMKSWLILRYLRLRENFPYSEIFWSAFSGYGPNTEKYRLSDTFHTVIDLSLAQY